MKRLSVALAAVVVSFVSAAKAETVDLSTVTCDQLKNSYRDDAELIIAWLDGSANGKSGNTKVDVKSLGANIGKVEMYCDKNGKSTVAQAIQQGAAAK